MAIAPGVASAPSFRLLFATVGTTLAAAAGACASTPSGLAPAAGEWSAARIDSVSILDDASTQWLPLRSLLVEGGRIAWIGHVDSVPEGPEVPRIAGRGAYLVPALIDAHAHDAANDRFLHLGNGVTTVRVMWGTPGQLAHQREVTQGRREGPRLVLASPGHDGQPPSWPLTREVLSIDAVPAALDRVASEDWAFVKVYDHLPRSVYREMLREGANRRLRIVGHVPFGATLTDALDGRQASIEHFTGYDRALAGAGGWSAPDSLQIDALARATAEAGTWNCPTLGILRRFAVSRSGAVGAEREMRGRAMLLRRLHASGARLLIGTDAGIGIIAAGAGLIDEMEEFVAAGLPRATVLQLATRDAAEFLGDSRELGRVAVGYRAELLLLPQDPLESFSGLRAPSGLLTADRYFDRAQLARFRDARP